MTRVVAVATVILIGLNTVILSAQTVVRPPVDQSPFSREAISRALASVNVEGGTSNRQDDKGWARVVKLKRGTTILVTVTGRAPANRVLVKADDTTLTVVQVQESTPPPLVGLLRDMARDEPDRLVSLTKTGSYRDTYTGIQINSEGVFLSGQKLGTVSDFVVKIDKADVVEIKKGGRTAAAWIILGAVGGALLTAVIADSAGADDDNALPILAGGAAAGGIATAVWWGLTGAGLIYRR